MAKGQIFETIVGVCVLGVAAGFLYYAYDVSGRSALAGAYPLHAVFGRVDGVTVGSEVRIAGVKVGAVTDNALEPTTYEAKLTFSISDRVSVPEDSIAKIVSDGLIGGAHVAIEPGGSDVMLKGGETITVTQGSVDLLGLAVQTFSNSKKSDNEVDEAPAPADAPNGEPQ
jgi:phospholipid/cholesterol/gamma-HCH transport system substrate-binding protein